MKNKADEITAASSIPGVRKVLTVITYDIKDGAHRRQVVKLLESFGVRVQKSVFEAKLDKCKYRELCRRLEKITLNDDNIKVYRVPGSYEVKCFGCASPQDFEEAIIF